MYSNFQKSHGDQNKVENQNMENKSSHTDFSGAGGFFQNSVSFLSWNIENSASFLSSRLKPQAPFLMLRSSWNIPFSASVKALKTAGLSMKRDIRVLRMVTDHAVPTIILPSGVKLCKSVEPKGEWYFPSGEGLGKRLQSLPYPTGAPIERDVILYFHGGAFCCCTTKTHRGLLFRLVKYSGAIVLAVDYRRPPESPFPAPVEDCFSAYRWLLQNFDSSRIIFAGDSAGGGLVAATAIAAVKAGFPKPRGGIMLSPWVDLADIGEGVPESSWSRNEHFDYLPKDLAMLFAESYRGDSTRQEVSPALSNELHLLPPLHIEVGECEVLLDQIFLFANRCKTAGVTVSLNVRTDMIHVFPLFAFTGMKQCKMAFEAMARFVYSTKGYTNEQNLLPAIKDNSSDLAIGEEECFNNEVPQSFEFDFSNTEEKSVSVNKALQFSEVNNLVDVCDSTDEFLVPSKQVLHVQGSASLSPPQIESEAELFNFICN